jgi:hypothetical protein
VSPDLVPPDAAERVVAAAVSHATQRARWLAAAEAFLFGLAGGAISLAAGALVAVAVASWRWRSTPRASIVRALERALSDAGNLFVTADELAREALDAKPAVRARVFADAAACAQRLDLRVAFPAARLARVALLAAIAWAAVETVHLWSGSPPAGSGVVSRTASPNGAPARPRLRLSVAIHPPAYTALEATTVVDPEQLQAIEGSVIVLSIDTSAAGVRVEHDGRERSLARGADRRFGDRLLVTRTGYLAVSTADGARRTIPVVVSPDALPAVHLAAPGRDLVYAGGNPRIAFDARATDDFGLRSLVLRYTRVTGSGENYDFQEGEIPLTVKRASPRDWAGTASRSLTELDLKDGDMLVYRAVAADARPGDGTAASDAFFIEISRLGVAAGDAFTLPEEESKYALSQQMLIVKTERLHQRRASLAAAALEEQSLNLAVEQRMIRAEFVFMLGGEINDEEVEAEQSTELQAGRLQNRGQRDLRAATIAMSQAEKLLTGTNTADALIAERAAVAALQRAFARDRYILRALATRSQLDPARRLTGSLADATGWRRTPSDVPGNRRTALLQDLLRGIAELVSVRLKPDTTETASGTPVVSGLSRTPAETASGTPVVSGLGRTPADTASGSPVVSGLKRPPAESASGTPVVSGLSRTPADTASGTPIVSGLSRTPAETPSGSAAVSGLSRTPAETASGTPVVSGFSRTRALVLAEEAIRIDPASASLRQAATELQRAADATDPAVLSKALGAASVAAATEARRAHADAPLASPDVAPGLSGAFADAITRRTRPGR